MELLCSITTFIYYIKKLVGELCLDHLAVQAGELANLR